MTLSIIIIGAGASGLVAARRLSAAGYWVTVLEAGAAAGGRILSWPAGKDGFTTILEGGAEFVHGELPVSLQLAREADIALEPVNGHMVRLQTGQSLKNNGDNRFLGKDWEELMKKMEAMEGDEPIADFMTRHFSGEKYAALRDSVKRFAEGYDLADVHRVSTRGLHNEWAREGDDEEYRLKGGYGRLIEFLVAGCRRQGCVFHFSSPVTEIRWQEEGVEVMIADGSVFVARQVLVTASLGVLQAEPAMINFLPAISGQLDAVRRLGYGSVIKLLLEFRRPFWAKEKKSGETLFIISEEPVPTWWTQSDDSACLLTGWLAGDRMRAFQALDQETRIGSCLRSLSVIFSMSEEKLRQELVAVQILDWAQEPYIRGGYSYDTVDAAAVREQLLQPVGRKIWFAGEALYEGIAPGTVEAAFTSGLETAERIIAAAGER